jgi:hypothetical protein
MQSIVRAGLQRSTRVSAAVQLPLFQLTSVAMGSQRAHISTTVPLLGPKNKGKGGKGDAAPAADAAAPSKDSGAGGAEIPAGKDLKSTLAKHIEHAKKELSKLRGATASASMLDHVTVEAYGEVQSLPSVAQIVLKNPNLIVVNPFDAAVSVQQA